MVAGRRIGWALVPACGLALALPVLAGAAPADLDRSFGASGTAVVQGPSGPQFPTQAPARVAIGPKDEIFVLYAGTASCAGFANCSIGWSVARFDRDGVRDPAFGTGPNSSLVVRGNEYEEADLAVGADGKPVVAALDERKVIVERFDLEGHLEARLGANDQYPLEGGGYNPPVIAVQGDGKVVVTVEGGLKEGGSDLRVVRYLPNGERDPGFGTGGEAVMTLGTRSRPSGALLGADGSVSIAGPQCCGGSGTFFGEGFSLARFLSDGRPDPGLTGDGQLLFPTPGARGNVNAAVLAPGGGIFIAFEASTETVSTVGNVVKLLPDGSLDPGFGGDGAARFPMSVDSLAVDAKGRLLAGGWSGGAAVFRMRSDGGLERTFDGGQPVRLPSSGPGTIALQSTGKIIVLGEPCCGLKSYSLYRLTGGTDHTRCLHRKATIVGTQGPDELTGTPRRDVIAALGGKDEVRAMGGADLICGGKGKDKLFGGAGKDQVQPDPTPAKHRLPVR